MPATENSSQQNIMHFYAPFAATLVIVLFLFFIDEGYYDFRWMKDAGNWVVFFIYLIAIFPVQWVISRLTFSRSRGFKKIALVSLVGVPVTLVVFYGIISFI